MNKIKTQILEIVEKYPKHYTRIIKSNEILHDWVIKHSLVESEQYNIMIYSVVYNISNICKYGNLKSLPRWSTGFVGCGPANKCECTKENISNSVTASKSVVSEQSKHISNKKRINTMVQKYGVEYNSQRQDIKYIWKTPKIPKNIYDKLMSHDWLYEQYVTKNRTAVDIAKELEVYYSTVIFYCKHHNFTIKRYSNYSLYEIEIKTFLEELNVNVIDHDYSILKTKELDLFLPEHKFAIEFNGLYWHSYHPSMNEEEDQYRHLEKTELANLNNINLFHINEWEWINHKSLIKSMIKSKIGYTDRIYARNCKVVQLSKLEAKIFFNENHLQQWIGATHYWGLKYHNEIVMAISISPTRFNNKLAKFELIRFCSKQNLTVVGGGSKLIKYAKSQLNSNIVSYCDRSKSNGNSYLAMGFKLVQISKPSYVYVKNNLILSRYQCQKHKQEMLFEKNIIDVYDKNCSESENMFNSGFRRFWDCGNLIFLLE